MKYRYKDPLEALKGRRRRINITLNYFSIKAIYSRWTLFDKFSIKINSLFATIEIKNQS